MEAAEEAHVETGVEPAVEGPAAETAEEADVEMGVELAVEGPAAEAAGSSGTTPARAAYVAYQSEM